MLGNDCCTYYLVKAPYYSKQIVNEDQTALHSWSSFLQLVNGDQTRKKYMLCQTCLP